MFGKSSTFQSFRPKLGHWIDVKHSTYLQVSMPTSDYSNEVNGPSENSLHQGQKNPMGKKLNTFMLGQSICLSWCMLACLLPSSSCLLPSRSCVLASFCRLLPSCSCVLPSRFPLPTQTLCCTLPSFSLSAWSCTLTYRIGTKNICGFLEEKRSHENYNHTVFAAVAKILLSCMHCTVEGIFNHFIFKVLIFWEKVKVSLALEN